MSRLSFQEKMLWGQLLGIAVVVVFYAHYLQHAAPGHHYFHALILILLFLFGSVRLLARRSSSVVEDERDRSIASMGARWSNLILWVGLIVVLVLYWDDGRMLSVKFMVAVLFHLLVLAGCVRIVRELVAYRMSV
jgi:uncharacterized membrane protein